MAHKKYLCTKLVLIKEYDLINVRMGNFIALLLTLTPYM